MLSDLMPPAPVGTFWFDAPAVRCIGRGGLRAAHDDGCNGARTANVYVVPADRLSLHVPARRQGGSAASICRRSSIRGLPPAGDDGDVLGYLQKLVGLQAYALTLPSGMPVFDTVDVDARHLLAMDNPPRSVAGAGDRRPGAVAVAGRSLPWAIARSAGAACVDPRRLPLCRSQRCNR